MTGPDDGTSDRAMLIDERPTVEESRDREAIKA